MYKLTTNYKRGNMNKEQLEARINTYAMMHQALRNKGINDMQYYNQMIQAIKELKDIINNDNSSIIELKVAA
jgi:hypothetical protein